MRCKTCDYPLWNIPPGSCPECGSGFKPSDFRFVPNAVQFCCPRCGQDYYGTDEQGHLEPTEFDCARCGNPVSMDEMRLLPTAGVQEDRTGLRPFPWLDKALGRSSRTWRTIGVGMAMPSAIAERISGPPRVGAALRFAATAVGFVVLVNALLGVILIGATTYSSPGGGPGAFGFASIFIMPLFGAVIWMISILVLGAVQHGFLAVTGPTKHGMGGTLETLSYCSAPIVICAIPCFGYYFIPITAIWTGIVHAIALQARQEVSGWRAWVAGLIFPGAWVLVTAGIIAWFVILVSSAMGSLQTSVASSSERMQLMMLHSALETTAQRNGGANPAHAAELIGSYTSASEFVSMRTATTAANVPVGNATLDVLDIGQLGQRERAVVARASALLPADTIAHRLGDFVFTYHGIALDSSAPASLVASPAADDLWVVFACPDPGLNPPTAGGQPGGYSLWTVIEADGHMDTITDALFSQELASQNTLRTNVGLAPLPDPRLVTHASPVTAAAMNGPGYTP